MKLKDTFFSLKILGVDDVSFNIIKKYVFPDDLKIAKVTLTCKVGDNSHISNYRPISVLPCFSKILERLMYNCLYKYLKEIIKENSSVFKADIPPAMPSSS